MAQRFEDAAALMRQLDQSGFELEQHQGNRIIKHQNDQVFSSFGFILEGNNDHWFTETIAWTIEIQINPQIEFLISKTPYDLHYDYRLQPP